MSSEMPPADRPDPADQPPHLRARVPDHVSAGVFSSGVIVMTGPTEFVLDFVQTIGRPHRIAARIVMPHPVMPQFIEALKKNIEIFQGRFGSLPAIVSPPRLPIAPQEGATDGGAQSGAAGPGATASGAGVSDGETPRKPTPQEVYDDLKMPDQWLSGVYANGVMIGHGASEFSLDFLTSFFPQSAVSARVYLAAGQMPRLVDSLNNAWLQFRERGQNRPPGEQPPPPSPE